MSKINYFSRDLENNEIAQLSSRAFWNLPMLKLL